MITNIKKELTYPIVGDDDNTPLREKSIYAPEPEVVYACDADWGSEDESSWATPQKQSHELFEEKRRNDLQLEFLEELSFADLAGVANVASQMEPKVKVKVEPLSPENEQEFRETKNFNNKPKIRFTKFSTPVNDRTQMAAAQQQQQDQSQVKPPPIIIPNIEDAKSIIQTAIALVGRGAFTTRATAGNGICFQCLTMENHTTLLKLFASNKGEYRYRIVIKGLHSSTSEDWISRQLARLGHIVCHVENISDQHDRHPTSYFRVNLLPNNNNKDVLKVTMLGTYTVTIQQYRIYQCYRCQRFDHRYEDCQLEGFICFKCAGAHHHTECPNPKMASGKCANCRGNHVACDTRCPVYKIAERIAQINNIPNKQKSKNTDKEMENPTKQQNKKKMYHSRSGSSSSEPIRKQRRINESSSNENATSQKQMAPAKQSQPKLPSIIVRNVEDANIIIKKVTSHKEMTPAKQSQSMLPSFIVRNVKDAKILIKKAMEAVGRGSFTTRATAGKGICFQCPSIEKYRILLKLFEDQSDICEIHFRIVIKGLHPATSEDWISRKLASLGHTVCHAKNIIDSNSKLPRNMFSVDLFPSDNNKDVLKVTMLGTYKISIESRKTYQCHRCQRFDHRYEDCQLRGFICFKCAGSHHHSACPKPKNASGKCANCQGNHVASDTRCPVYKEAMREQLLSLN
ncbi:hypothetical protein ACLKA7_008879 [Drosophila subpalustris]